jgi:hypothetical protein
MSFLVLFDFAHKDTYLPQQLYPNHNENRIVMSTEPVVDAAAVVVETVAPVAPTVNVTRLTRFSRPQPAKKLAARKWRTEEEVAEYQTIHAPISFADIDALIEGAALDPIEVELARAGANPVPPEQLAAVARAKRWNIEEPVATDARAGRFGLEKPTEEKAAAQKRKGRFGAAAADAAADAASPAAPVPEAPLSESAQNRLKRFA